MGSTRCAYETASGRRQCLNRDPLEEEGGINLYNVLRNDLVNRKDPLGLAESLFPDNTTGVGSVNNCTSNTFNGIASSGGSLGRWGPDAPVKIPPGKTGGNGTNPPPMFKNVGLRDIDFLFPSPKQPINGKTNGMFKIGGNEVKLTPDPKNPGGCQADNYNSYVPPAKK